MGTEMKLESLKMALKEVKEKGIEIEALYAHPLTIPSVIAAVASWGEDPFPKSRWSWRKPFRGRDGRPYFCGIPVEMSPSVPMGAFGSSTASDVIAKILQSYQEKENQEEENGVVDELSDDHSLTGLMIKGMEGLDKCHHIVILRFTNDGMESISNYTQLELPTILQQSVMRMMQDGMR